MPGHTYNNATTGSLQRRLSNERLFDIKKTLLVYLIESGIRQAEPESPGGLDQVSEPHLTLCWGHM